MDSATALGYSAKASGDSAIALGRNTNASGASSTALGYSASVSTEKTIQLGYSGLSALKCAVALTVTSDERDKTNIQPIENALELINKIEPITYVRNDRENYIISEENASSITNAGILLGDRLYDKDAHQAALRAGSRRRAGVKAQQIQQLLIDMYGTDNYADLVCDNLIDNPSDNPNVESQLGVNYDKFIPFLIKAIQEQQVEIEELRSKIK